jgi:hypothetical protein
LHAGDFTNYGNGAEEFAIWFHGLPYKLKLLTLGNHELTDSVAYRPPEHWQSLFGPMLLLDRGVRANIGGVSLTVFGLPHATKTEAIPAGVDVVLSHEPPYRILDATHGGGHAGSERIADLVGQARPQLHVFGHVHAGGGKTETAGGVTHVNAATRAVIHTLQPSRG